MFSFKKFDSYYVCIIFIFFTSACSGKSEIRALTIKVEAMEKAIDSLRNIELMINANTIELENRVDELSDRVDDLEQ